VCAGRFHQAMDSQCQLVQVSKKLKVHENEK